MLTEEQKVNVRRHCGFPVFGAGGATPPGFGYRYYKQYMALEYRMNNLAPQEEVILQTKYLTNCDNLEEAIPTASTNLDTDQAAVWYHNKYEVRDRFQLYKLWCSRMMDFLDVYGPAKLMGGLRIVV